MFALPLIMLLSIEPAISIKSSHLMVLHGHIDANKDGHAEDSEIGDFMRLVMERAAESEAGGAVQNSQESLESFFKMMDADSSGTVSSEEYRALAQDIAGEHDLSKELAKDHADMDLDGDGKLTLAEFKGHFSFMNAAAKMIELGDSNGDGKLSMAELQALPVDKLPDDIFGTFELALKQRAIA